MALSGFGPPDVSWRSDEHLAGLNQPTSVLNTYDIEAAIIALNLVWRANQNEPQISSDVVSSTPSGWRTAGFEHRVKSPASLARKIEILVLGAFGRDVSIDNFAAEINDSLRYTFVSSSIGNFSTYIKSVSNGLENRGYRVTQSLNTFHPDMRYVGFHVSYKSPFSDSLIFEVQFHTEQSYETKQITDSMYHQWRTMAHSEDRSRLEQRMVKLSSQVQLPKGLSQLQLGGVMPFTPKARKRK